MRARKSLFALRCGHHRRNALALADLAGEHYIDALIVTSAWDVAEGGDRVLDEEVDASRSAFGSRGRPIHWHDTLAFALNQAGALARPGDLIVLPGAQGNEGKRLLSASL